MFEGLLTQMRQRRVVDLDLGSKASAAAPPSSEEDWWPRWDTELRRRSPMMSRHQSSKLPKGCRSTQGFLQVGVPTPRGEVLVVL